MSNPPVVRNLNPLPALIFSSRWLQLPLYLGLIIAQGVYVVLFLKELWHLITHATTLSEQLIMLAVLGLTSFGALGLVVASVTNTMQETQIINQIIWLIMLFLSGATLPLALLPSGAFTAATYANSLTVACT